MRCRVPLSGGPAFDIKPVAILGLEFGDALAIASPSALAVNIIFSGEIRAVGGPQQC